MSLSLLQEDVNIIPYRPNIAKVIGIVPSIILQQIIYYHGIMKGQFYKFTQPTDNKLYKEGDSWCETLGMGVDMFNDNLKRIGFKLGKTKNIIEKEDAFVIYYTDSNRVTYYDINVNKIEELLSICYNTNYLVNGNLPDTKVNGKMPDTIPSENTTKNKYMSEISETNTQIQEGKPDKVADVDKKPALKNKGERFEEFWKTFPHPRGASKKDTLDFYRRNDLSEEEILFESKLLDLKIKYSLQDIRFVKGCALWTKDLTKTQGTILQQTIKQIMYMHMKNPKKVREDAQLLFDIFGKELFDKYVKEYNQEFNSVRLDLK